MIYCLQIINNNQNVRSTKCHTFTLENWEEKFKKEFEPVYYRVKRCLHIGEITEMRETIKRLIEEAEQKGFEKGSKTKNDN